VLARPEWAVEYPSLAERDRRRDELLPLLEEAFVGRTTSDWVEQLTTAGVPCAPVNDVMAALADPQVAAREALVEIEHETLAPVRQVASPLRLSDAPHPLRRAPRRGEHTDEVLERVCGYDAARIARLRDTGALG
jgi:crotonobetainyl-CoA:carnitine CoA-transferase CaiB-like acyl-CoA transferase